MTDKHFIINLLRMFSYFKNQFESWEPPIDHGSLGKCSWKTWTRNKGRAHPVKIITISLAVPYTVCIYMYKCNKTFKINKYVMYNVLKKINIYVCCFGGDELKGKYLFSTCQIVK